MDENDTGVKRSQTARAAELESVDLPADDLAADLTADLADAPDDVPIGESVLGKNTQHVLHRYRAHWHIFVPTIVICILYISGWVTLYVMDKSGGDLARLFIVVLAVGVPLLLAHAFLRYQTISLEIFDSHLQYHTGWPKAEPVKLPFTVIDKIDYTRGLSGRIFGGGTVILQLVAGEAIGIADVEKPAEATANVAELMA